MGPQINSDGSLVCQLSELSQVPARADGITKGVVFENFAIPGLPIVGLSLACHNAGVECGLHDHRGAHELFVVWQGEGEIQVGYEVHKVTSGTCLVVPPGVIHNVVASTADFKVLCMLVRTEDNENDKQPWLSTGLSTT